MPNARSRRWWSACRDGSAPDGSDASRSGPTTCPNAPRDSLRRWPRPRARPRYVRARFRRRVHCRVRSGCWPGPSRWTRSPRCPTARPLWFRWRGLRHRTARAEGPERIALDWWTLPGWQSNPDAPGQPPALGAAIRDYWRIEDTAGRRYWLYRAGLHRTGAPARWYLHGVFP